MDEVNLIYLDHNSTTPLAPEVLSVITSSLHKDWANPSSTSELGNRARKTIENARYDVARMVNSAEIHDIIFTSGGTESNNMAIQSAVEWGLQRTPTPHVILSNVEHVATSIPIKKLASKGVITYTEVAVNGAGCLETTDVIASVRPDTVLVTVMMANNETGVIFPIQDIGRELRVLNQKHKLQVWFHVDAAQTIGKICVDVQKLGVDYLTIVGHKFYGPRIGALYVRKSQTELNIQPVVWGGGQEHGLRPGTENTPMIAGLGKAAELVALNLEAYTGTMRETRDYLVELLQAKTNNFVLNCCESPRLPNTASVSWGDCQLSGSQILQQCPTLVASTTAACHDQTQLSEVLLASGVSKDLSYSTIRLSVGRSTIKKQIDVAVKELAEVLEPPRNSPLTLVLYLKVFHT